ncbi:MFS transporter [Burkholderia pseudomallei]|uniref:MFS transporter n=1 Tax=Burkholderia pseudomallei TaxID=28450 RepID=UPI0010616F4A|nr:MFS transporter [Burkholderia pseudomallei]MDA0561036.1 MFS transporter [Burkholderia pseudomallei]
MRNVDLPVKPSIADGQLYMATVLTHTALTGGRVAVSLSAIGAHMSPLMIGVLIALFAVFPMLLATHTGRWIDHVGIRLPLFSGAGLTVLGCFGPAVQVSVGTLMWSSSAIGVGFMMYQVAMQNLLGRSELSRRLRNYSRLAMTQSVSAFCGPVLVGGVLDTLGNRMTFGLLSIFPAVAIALLLTQRARLRCLTSSGERERKADTDSLFAEPTVRRILIMNTVLSGAWDTHTFLLPLYGTAIGLSATGVGIIMAAFAMAAFLARLGTSLATSRVAPSTLLMVVTVCAACVFAVYPLVNNQEELLALSFLLGLALGASQPNVMALLHEAAPPKRIAEAVGLRVALVNMTQFAIPLGFGALGSALGTLPLFWGYAFILAALASWKRWPHRSGTHDQAEERA